MSARKRRSRSRPGRRKGHRRRSRPHPLHPLTRFAMCLIVLLIPVTVIGMIRYNSALLILAAVVFVVAFLLAMVGAVLAHRAK